MVSAVKGWLEGFLSGAISTLRNTPKSEVATALRGGRRGGRGRSSPAGELEEVKATLRELTEGVLSGRRDKSIATVANLLLNTRLRAVELERKWREIQELEGRLEALEGVLKGRTKAE